MGQWDTKAGKELPERKIKEEGYKRKQHIDNIFI